MEGNISYHKIDAQLRVLCSYVDVTIALCFLYGLFVMIIQKNYPVALLVGIITIFSIGEIIYRARHDFIILRRSIYDINEVFSSKWNIIRCGLIDFNIIVILVTGDYMDHMNVIPMIAAFLCVFTFKFVMNLINIIRYNRIDSNYYGRVTMKMRDQIKVRKAFKQAKDTMDMMIATIVLIALAVAFWIALQIIHNILYAIVICLLCITSAISALIFLIATAISLYGVVRTLRK